jgi:hypothetical protein
MTGQKSTPLRTVMHFQKASIARFSKNVRITRPEIHIIVLILKLPEAEIETQNSWAAIPSNDSFEIVLW